MSREISIETLFQIAFAFDRYPSEYLQIIEKIVLGERQEVTALIKDRKGVMIMIDAKNKIRITVGFRRAFGKALIEEKMKKYLCLNEVAKNSGVSVNYLKQIVNGNARLT